MRRATSTLQLRQLLSIKAVLNDYLKRLLAPLSLTPQQGLILFLLGNSNSSLTLGQLSGLMGLSDRQISNLSIDLQDRKLILRKASRNEAGKLIVTLELTEVGTAVLATADRLDVVPCKYPETKKKLLKLLSNA